MLGVRLCSQLSHRIEAARWTPDRKLRPVLSKRVAMPRKSFSRLKKFSMACRFLYNSLSYSAGFFNLLPNVFPAPSVEADIDTVPIPEALGQVAPRDARTKTIQDRFDKEAIVSGSHTHFPWLPRQSQLLEFLPLIVTQGIPLFHASYFTERDTLFENTA